MKTFYDWCIENNRENVLKEWHPTKNGNLTLKDVSYGSTVKRWWMCEKGHEWEATPCDRQSRNCPYCSNRKVLVGYNDLATTHPEIASEWHPTKNGNLKPTDIVAGSRIKVWWICEHSHEWETTPDSRVKGYGCPYCNNKRVLAGYNDLATKFPELVKEWHPTKNGSLKPTMITYGSNQKVWWKCEKGHEWDAQIQWRTTQNQGCPYCSNKRVLQGYNDLETTHPELAKEWHPTKNSALKPTMVTFGSKQKVWWQCKEGHEWDAPIVNRTGQNQGCPICSNRRIVQGINDLKTLNLRVASEWHPTKNGNLKPEDVSVNSTFKVWWQCDKGHEWKAPVINRTLLKQNCPKCSEHRRVSFPEKAIFYYIKQAFPDAEENFKIPYTRNSELDIFIEDINLGIEYDGSYYHKRQGRDAKKYSICKEYGISLIRIREQECQMLNDIATACYYLKASNNKDLDNAIKFVFAYINDNYEPVKTPDIDIERDSVDIFNLIEFQEKENSLINKSPELAKEWHPTKNGKLTPSNTLANSNMKVWWVCDKGHEYKASVSSRYNRNTGCPYCANQKVIVGYNDLATTHPQFAKEWHPTKNGDLKPTDVIAGAERKVWWMCEKGHEWEAALVSRTRQNQGCPYCSNHRLLVGYNDLATTNPELIKEWHLTKNGNLKPTDVIAGSSKKVWWICENGHEWEASIYSRKMGSCCPICNKTRVLQGYNDLATTHPEIAKEWHPSKNGNLKPSDVISGGGEKYWWLCKDGHEWQASISARKLGSGCPICGHFIVKQGYNDLATTHLELAKEWHPTKNGNLKPTDVVSAGGEKVWWQCEHGHEWEATIIARKNGSGCPICANKKIKQGYNDLATTNPKIAKEWHPTKNGNLKPTDVFAGSDKKVWWKCEKGHEWEAKIETRTLLDTGCPYCKNRKVWQGYNDVATLCPDLAEEWHPTKNGDLKPTEISAFSNTKVWWQCKKCGYEWEIKIINRKEGTGCPRCANLAITVGYNDLATTNPEIAKEWHPTKNGDLKPTEVVLGSSKKVWWQCENGHEWQANIKDRQKGGCPYCSNKKVLKGYNDMATTHPQIAREWNHRLNGDLKPTDVSIGSNKKVWWKCKKCGHEWQAPCYYRKEGSGCPECRKKKRK